jgi:hypothetical protein
MIKDQYINDSNKTVELSNIELEFFYNEVETIKRKLNVYCDIFNFNHDLMNNEMALGCCHTNGSMYIITIDNYYIHEIYNGNDFITTLNETICHEIAHLQYWTHSVEHDSLTKKYLSML